MARVLVTGGAGYIGSFTSRALSSRRIEIEILDNLSTGHSESIASDVRVHRCDLLENERLAGIVSTGGFDGIVHFAAKSLVGESVSDPLKYYQNNITGSLNLVRAACDAGIKNFIFSSTAATYGNPTGELVEEHPTVPINPYGRSKLAVEAILMDVCAAHGLRAIPLRYFNAAGAEPDGSAGEDHTPETHLIPLAITAALGLRPELHVFGDDYSTSDGTPIRDYVHVRDLAEAHVRALLFLMEQGDGFFQPMNVGTGKGSTVFEVLRAVERAVGRPVPYSTAPRRAGDPVRLVACAERIRETLGWAAEYSDLDQIAASAAAWHRSHPRGWRSE